MSAHDNPREVVQEYLDAYNERAMDRIKSVVANEIESNHGQLTREELTEAIKSYWTAFPDCEIDTEQFVIDDEMISVRIIFSGTHEGDYRGIESTGREFEVQEIMMWRVTDGELDGYWPVWDELGFYEQLGVIEHPAK